MILFLDDISGGSSASGLGGAPRLSKIDFHGCLDSFDILFLLYFKEVWPPSLWTAEWCIIGLQWQDGVPCWGVWNGDNDEYDDNDNGGCGDGDDDHSDGDDNGNDDDDGDGNHHDSHDDNNDDDGGDEDAHEGNGNGDNDDCNFGDHGSNCDHS